MTKPPSAKIIELLIPVAEKAKEMGLNSVSFVKCAIDCAEYEIEWPDE